LYKPEHFAKVDVNSNFDYSPLLSNYYERYVTIQNVIKFQNIRLIFQSLYKIHPLIAP